VWPQVCCDLLSLFPSSFPRPLILFPLNRATMLI
jgi:hypothetical protein